MALHKVAVAAKDGAGTTIPGGIQQHDTSGTGAGPNDPLLVLIDSSGAEILGTTADAAATQTDTTALSGMSVWKQISKSIQAAAASLAGTLTVATHAVTNAGTFAVQATLQAGSALVGIVKIGDGTNTMTVKAASTPPVTATDTAGVMVLRPDSAGIIPTGSQASPSSSYLSTIAAGDIGAAATDSGNPLKIGGVGHTANPTAVTDGQRVNAIFDKLGKQVVVGGLRDMKVEAVLTLTSSTTETTLQAAVASTFLDLYLLTIDNTSATATEVVIRDATAGGKARSFMVPAGETRGFALPIDSAVPQGAVNNNWTAQCTTSVSSVKITALFVKNI